MSSPFPTQPMLTKSILRGAVPLSFALGLALAVPAIAQTATAPATPPAEATAATPAPVAPPADPAAAPATAPAPAATAPAGPAPAAPAPAATAPAPAATNGAGTAVSTTGSTPTQPTAAPAPQGGTAGASTAPPPAAATAPAAAAPAAATAPAPAAGTAPASAPATAAAAPASGGPDLTPPTEQRDGIWYTAEGNPSFKIAPDGTLDYATFAGYIRYTAECMVCHGPDGMGSTYAPPLKDAVMRMTYSDFTGIVAGGKQDVGAAANLVMPSFGNNNNVMCYLDDIYAYLLARGTNTIDRGRPQKKEKKSDAFKAAEDSCMG